MLFSISDTWFIILQPAKFLKGLETLYNCAKKPRTRWTKNGFLRRNLAERLWNVEGNEYISVFIKFHLMVKIPDTELCFMPTLRFKHYKEIPSKYSNSLIVLYSRSLLPFSKQCEFVTEILKLKNDCYRFTLEYCLHYNVINFRCEVSASAFSSNTLKIAVRFRSDYLELCITDPNCDSEPVNIICDVCNLLKTACTQVLSSFAIQLSNCMSVQWKWCPTFPRP